jgi:hypothetical protein
MALLKDTPLSTAWPGPEGGTLGTVSENAPYGDAGYTLKNAPETAAWPPTYSALAPANAVLDSFSGTLANWINPAASPMQISGGVAIPVNVGGGGMFWNGTSPTWYDGEAYFTMPTAPGGTNKAYLRWRAKNSARSGAPVDNSTWSGYFCEINIGANTLKCFKYDGIGSPIQIGSTVTLTGLLAPALAAGDSFWVAHVGATITMYRKPSGGSYAVVLRASDNDYSDGWHGPEVDGNVGTIDNYGGGVVTVVNPPPALGSALPARMPETVGNVYYVDAVNGNDTRTSTQAQSTATPWQTIQKAIDSVGGTSCFIRVRGTLSGAPTDYTVTNGVVGRFEPSRGNGSGNLLNPCTIEAMPASTGTGVRRGKGWFENVRILSSTNGGTGNAGWMMFFLDRTKGLRIRGFEMTTPMVLATPSSTAAAGIMQNPDGIEICQNLIHHTYGHGFGGFSPNSSSDTAYLAPNLAWGQNIYIIDNEFHHIAENNGALATMTFDPSTGGGYYRRGTHPLYIGGNSQESDSVDHRWRNIVIANNIFHDNRWGKEMEIGNATLNVYVVNNTSYRHGQGSSPQTVGGNDEIIYGLGQGLLHFGVGGLYQSYEVHYVNNIVKDAIGYAISGGAGQYSVFNNEAHNNLAHGCRSDNGGMYNDWRGATDSTSRTYTKGPQLLVGDPLFTNAAAGDFSLGALSPAKGTADSAYCPPYDFFGTLRSASTPSMGAVGA